MSQISTWIGRWWAWPEKTLTRRNAQPFAFRLRVDPTLMNPGAPGMSCTALEFRRIRESNGTEPATRTLVRSCVAGHTVKILLLKHA
ncbi:MAG: hypothetical protein NT138_16695 [Planctomycetales bacterium]|nr:hypothetical protein [Planctomycetales bacterium]